jgi:acyl-CoA synthetase (AMP-forming)/AMP-acid ligase II
MTTATSSSIANVGLRLSETARQMPDAPGVVTVRPRRSSDRARQYDIHTFRELDDDTNRIATGLRKLGIPPQTRLALLVRPGYDFIALVFALFKAGMVPVLIDPGMGIGRVLGCLREVEPEGFVAIPAAHAIRTVLRRRFPRARWNVTVGRRWFWGGPTLDEVRRAGAGPVELAETHANDPAAIIFTSGSTGSAKGVLYRHGNFCQQVDELRAMYGFEPGGVDVGGFPHFALFNCGLGVTTIVPDMDFSRPARVDPRNIVEAVNDWKATQAFGSPAMWNVVGRYCEKEQIRMRTLRRVFSAGAPVPPHVLRRMKEAIDPEGDVYTPYGATEALPVASIAASEVLAETAERSADGAGTCVGRRFPGIRWKVIRIVDGPIAEMGDIEELPPGEIGELMVTGGVVTREYVTQTHANALHKVRDGNEVWHRMGDVGYLDERDRFWFCGRKSQRLETARGPMFTVCCEAIANRHTDVFRSALVGVGPTGKQRPVMIVEPWPERRPQSSAERQRLLGEVRELCQSHRLTAGISDFFLNDRLPVDVRHNAKINREVLGVWAAQRARETASGMATES